LPEFIYSIAPDGLYVNLYASSEIAWNHNGVQASLSMDCEHPAGGQVRIKITAPGPIKFTLRCRIPAWVRGATPVFLNSQQIGTGIPGSYFTIEHEWTDGDQISFTLLPAMRVTRYTGADSVTGYERYAIEYGPLLMGIVGPLDFRGKYIFINQEPLDPTAWLEAVPGKPAHFTLKDKPGYACIPYYEIQDQLFSCYPVFS